MNNFLIRLVLAALFFISSSSCMDVTLTIRTSDNQEYSIPESVALTSETIKHLKEDAEKVEDAPIDLVEISKEQFELLLPPMTQLSQGKLALDEERKAIIEKLNNKQLIEFIAGAAYLEITLVEPALEILAQRILTKDEWEHLKKLGNLLLELWNIHPARKILLGGKNLLDGKKIVYSNTYFDTTKCKNKNCYIGKLDDGDSGTEVRTRFILLDKNNFTVEPIILEDSEIESPTEAFESNDQTRFVLADSGKGIVKVWEKSNTKPPVRLNYDGDNLRGAKCGGFMESNDGSCFISWRPSEGNIRLWSTTTYEITGVLMQEGGVIGVIESRDGSSIISLSLLSNEYYVETVQLLLWNKHNLANPVIIEQRKVNWLDHDPLFDTPLLQGIFRGEMQAIYRGEAIFRESEDGNHIFLGFTHEGIAKVWDKNNLEAGPIVLKQDGFPFPIYKLLESKDGRSIIGIFSNSQRVLVWNKNDLKATPSVLEARACSRFSPCFLECENHFILWSNDCCALTAWDKNDLKAAPIVLHQEDLDDLDNTHLVINSKDGRSIISISPSTIRIWDKNDLKAAPIVLEHTAEGQYYGRTTDYSFTESQYGNYVISWCHKEGTIRVWDKNDLKSGHHLLKHPWVIHVDDTPDYLISRSRNIIKVWKKNNLRAAPIVLVHERTSEVMESRDGRNIISIGKTLKVWDLPFLTPNLQQIVSILGIYYEAKGNQQFNRDQVPTKQDEIHNDGKDGKMLHLQELREEHAGDFPDEEQLNGAQKKRKEIENGITSPAKKIQLSQESLEDSSGEYSEDLKARLLFLFDKTHLLPKEIVLPEDIERKDMEWDYDEHFQFVHD